MPLIRRARLRAVPGIATAALAIRPPCARAQGGGAPIVAQFGALSATLTGYPQADPDTFGKMMRAFVTPARRADVAALAQLVAATAPDELDAAPTRTIRCDQPAMTTA